MMAMVEMLRVDFCTVAQGVQLYPYSNDSHPYTPGYERIARAVARALEERGFVARHS